MATTYKVLGQVAPLATTATTLYTCPSATETVISTITVCNQAASAGTYRISVRADAEADAAKQYIVYDASIEANSILAYTIGLTINAADVVTVYSSSTTISFNAFGSEIA